MSKQEQGLSGSKMLGSNAEQIFELGKFPGFNSDYIFVSVISAYGIFAGILVAALLAYLLIKIFRVSSSGGSGIVISYILLGLVLSVYRYQNILSDKLTPVKTLTFRFSLKI